MNNIAERYAKIGTMPGTKVLIRFSNKAKLSIGSFVEFKEILFDAKHGKWHTGQVKRIGAEPENRIYIDLM